ncbi:MAG: RimK family alpha-L-glutamate ligase [Clostridia bacterium]|nr:RimK family alpha-L-glutamate ligase [Clostridia bacterium]
MENYLVINAFLEGESFLNLYSALQNAFKELGQKLNILKNTEALSVLSQVQTKGPILFFDKDIYLAEKLQKLGYNVINSPYTIETCDDKAKTYLCLEGKVEMPKTLIAPFTYQNVGFTDYSFLAEVERQIGYPVIVKENRGSFGQGVYLARDYSELLNTVKRLNGKNILFQQFIKSSYGKDVRVYVVGNTAIAWGMRISENDFRSNVGAGGKMVSFDLPQNYKELAVNAAKCVKAHFAGIDLLIGDKGPLVCEVNSNAHFNALEKASGVNVAKIIAQYYLSLKK